MEGYFCKDAGLCKIKLGMSIFFKGYAAKKCSTTWFYRNTEVCPFYSFAFTELFFQKNAVFQLHKSKNHNANFINTAKFK